MPPKNARDYTIATHHRTKSPTSISDAIVVLTELSFTAIMALAEGVLLNHIARETPDVKRLAAFYEEVLGFQRVQTPNFGGFEVVWLSLPPSFTLHLIERNPLSGSRSEPFVRDPKALPRAHHVCLSVSNFDSFVQALKEKGIETFEKTQPDGKTKQVFFFDPDGYPALLSF
ncbi:Methylmalonyl-CoA epimerase protein [Dioscorea alata]|uniref:Methylmalonyl-CoA epimerase protein n=2 Tax=Dioscorea alata TaxID=55571 RepID=A0ACB7VMJ0_DIOAL|nr:Methylmalonyl-CoA epimerase protein [Dioscorea alata]KAH7675190.1 Methylmalonyl-CoA epimerase protein [Dioscorea alata]